MVAMLTRGQAVGCPPQGPLQGRERPGGGAVILPVRCPPHLGQDPLPLVCAVALRLPTTMPRRQAIKAHHQLGHRIATASPRRALPR